MNNYERLKTIMKNLCRELIGCYSIEEDGASVEDAYYLIDQYHKPAIVVTICRKVCEEDYREKAIFYVDSNNVSKFFLMDMNCKVSGYQIPSMTFNSFDVLHDIFKTFDNEYYRYRYISNHEGNKEECSSEKDKDKDIKDSISRKMNDIVEVVSNGFGESVKKVMKEKEDTEDKEKSEEEDIEKEVCKEMKNYKPIWDSYTNGIFSVNVERLKEITKRINDTLGGILGNEESEDDEDAGKEDDNVEESSEDEEIDTDDEEEEYEDEEDEDDEELDADEGEDNLCDICRERMEKIKESKESKDDTESRFKWFLISAKIDIFGCIVDPVFVYEWPIEYVTSKPLTHVESNNSIVEVSFVVPCNTSKDSEEDLENIYKNKLEEVVDHIYNDDCNDLTDDKELKDVFDFAINALIIERCNEFIR